jgi:hypothetical protein
VYAKQGNRARAPISVNDFDNIQAAAILPRTGIRHKLAYECVRGATGAAGACFQCTCRLLRAPCCFKWEDPNLLAGTGVTKADGSRIYGGVF